MFEIKYKEKPLLTEYDLSVELFDRYNIKVKDISPVRNVFAVRTNKGNKVLKKINYGLDELQFIYEAIKYIKNTFSRVVDFEKVETGEIYLKWENEVYCLMELIEGRECEFSNPVDVAIAARGIAEFHKASEGFSYDNGVKNNCGKTINCFKKRLEEIRFFKVIVNKYENKNEFDELFLQNVDLYLSQIENSINIMEKTEYHNLYTEKAKIAFCHHDLAHHNIIISNEEAYFIDYDYSILDLKVHDLCNFINKVIKSSAYDFQKCQLIINEYKSKNTIENSEMHVLYGLLSFPQSFYEIARDYYTRRKSWDEEVFLDKFKKRLELNEDYNEFLGEFRKILL
ncbi:MAG: CotS family spore coat protein [Clostridiaceae bacterium]|nr:CotS family spore coat protein [Clostridiaceae bacterium]